MYIVNAPYLFSGVWVIIKGFLDAKTVAKISISSSDKVLLEHVDKENLPDFLGGSCNCSFDSRGCLGPNVGPWNPEGYEMFPLWTKEKVEEVKLEQS
jgi:hypothetical protein